MTARIMETRKERVIVTLLQLFEMMDAKHLLMFSSDYPHWDSDNPDMVLPPGVPRAIADGDWELGANFYGHGFYTIEGLFHTPAQHLAEHTAALAGERAAAKSSATIRAAEVAAGAYSVRT